MPKTSQRDEIIRLLREGKTPNQLVGRGFSKPMVYRLNKQMEEGIIPGKDIDVQNIGTPPILITDKEAAARVFETEPPATTVRATEIPPATQPPIEEVEVSTAEELEEELERQTQAVASKTSKNKVDKETGMIVTMFPGEVTMGDLDAVRSAFQVTFRPTAISMPTPELLYSAMVIAIQEFGFPPMPPQDFIDTVLYQWLEAAGIIPRVYIKLSELEELVKQYGYDIFQQQKEEADDGSAGQRTKPTIAQDRSESEAERTPKEQAGGDSEREGGKVGAAV